MSKRIPKNAASNIEEHSLQKSIRFKIIRPVYETLTVNDQNARYLDAHLSSSRDVVRLSHWWSAAMRNTATIHLQASLAGSF
ncbi:MAG: hypothetical protein ACSLFH_14500 [Desulfuromonadales bacterium]